MYQHFRAIVLFTRPYKEQDGLVKLFTREFGTRMFFIKGFQSSNHPLKKFLIPFTENEYWGTINQQGFSFLKESQRLQLFRSIQTDPFKQAHAAYLSQLVDASIEDNDLDATLYDFFLQGLMMMEQLTEVRPIQWIFQMQLLQRFGVSIPWMHCSYCGEQTLPMDFSMRIPGMLCAKHLINDPHRMQISARVVALLQTFSQMNLSQVGKIELSETTYQEMATFLSQVYHDLVGLRLKSESYLHQLYQMMNPSTE